METYSTDCIDNKPGKKPERQNEEEKHGVKKLAVAYHMAKKKTLSLLGQYQLN